jgi:hypothetical protein
MDYKFAWESALNSLAFLPRLGCRFARNGKHRMARLSVVAAAALVTWLALPAGAQTPPGWQTDANPPSQDAAPANTTVVPRTLPPAARAGGGAGTQVSFAAYLTDESQGIKEGLVWRVFREKAGPDGKAVLLSTHRDASPSLRLEPGVYRVNVALGRAHLTRKITVTGEQPVQERFVLNAGGLRVVPVLASGETANARAVSYEVLSDERDQHGQRTKVVSAAKAGVVLRLNAGIYSIISTYGDANAVARTDVTVEAGKLSEVALAHTAARVSLKLVTRPGGDAIADTQWNIATAQGEAVKESAGALPTHYLAPGAYVVSAKHAGRTYRQQFAVRAGQNLQVEVVMP